MKKLISFTALCMAIFVTFCTAASAQNPEKQPTPEELAADEDVRTKYLGSGFVLKRSKSVERARREVEQEHRV